MGFSKIKCSLCDAILSFYTQFRNRDYYHCDVCDSIQMDSKDYINKEQEFIRYQKHNNDVNDLRYQNFVSPIVNYTINHYNKYHQGLDFGAGPGPVISKILKEQNYNIELYDLFFWNNPNAIERKYDYIIVCEVVEHFHNPKREFVLLKSMLKEKGEIIIMTNIYDDKIDFNRWYYKNDETHVFFYSEKTMKWIKDEYGFNNLTINKNLIVFTK